MKILHGDCLEVLRSLPDGSVDSVVTDPPYGLSFMGKRWDYDVPSEDIWRECLRVLKPGGHLLAFAGTRTQHRMAVRIEDAGFEIRDMIAWVYGSGFPKSLDVSKAMDKMDAAEAQQARRYRFTEWVRSQGVTSKQIDDTTGTNMGGHYTTAASQPAIMTREHLEACRYLFRDIPAWVEREADIRSVESKNFAAREVVGNGNKPKPTFHTVNIGGAAQANAYDITAPATDAAREWAGWGTALKPALEPITVARKPFAGTVAANVQAHGTGAINVDGCRVAGDEDGSRNRPPSKLASATTYAQDEWTRNTVVQRQDTTGKGRWPANLIHDGSEEVSPLLNGAARFFYCAKASKRDRDEGCEGLDEKELCALGDFAGTPEHGPKQNITRRNHHPTVKPTDLMRYLCRLVTPPGGVVLDPFMGSGSTGKAAALEGFQFIGIEREAEYVEIARARIAAVTERQQEALFA
jgi:DNA modification methylase